MFWVLAFPGGSPLELFFRVWGFGSPGGSPWELFFKVWGWFVLGGDLPMDSTRPSCQRLWLDCGMQVLLDVLHARL